MCTSGRLKTFTVHILQIHPRATATHQAKIFICIISFPLKQPYKVGRTFLITIYRKENRVPESEP